MINLGNGFERLVATYGEYGPEVQEWRAQPRKPAAASVPVVVERRTGARLQGTIRDLSGCGVGIHVPATMTVGEEIVLLASVKGRSVRLVARVANCRKGPSGTYLVGAQLVQADVKRGDGCGAPAAVRAPACVAPASAPQSPPRPFSNPAPAPAWDEGEDLLRRVALLVGEPSPVTGG
jgi:hypothetical protein